MSKATVVAALQLCATPNMDDNLDTTEHLAQRAREAGAEVIMLPEAFAFIGPDREKQQILEPLPEGGPILERCQRLARDLACPLILGGFHEQGPEPGRSYNTCVHLDALGEVVASYRKIHLFDVSLDDGTRLFESRGTAPGEHVVTTDLPFGKLGLTVCYDMRFPYLYQALVNEGAVAITIPSAFTATTGKAHWHVLLRARAIETQCHVIAPAQHGNHYGKRTSYGHSLIVDPWGEIVAEHAEGDGFALGLIDPERVRSVRKQLPSLEHRTTIA
ncbi:MAG: carbon-nitrogen hydrolase family protein [Pseudomonadales bacterium]|jgi:predicted amidohydrolase|nr:carbon-nitrogen hydrolase family protein [Pseudomonadales bacterium]MDP6470964.1 carbon-nitrogen hydrolase family protein [Pseudomonadales bacterium]MDP6825851.1 carbon-nitrogen hydrolase family protein [Pseudomonadales bacterium]MDP6972818.1 carbon-nitrogen hydrolase family protein [Pseudomonadales bacterium]|tara:strand:- start:266 stop:1087 length:822 start_codon:yes stop_codon:yes gene_type:complete